ncbi:uncharacterized protein BJ171DRAFT_567546 [Polychytrium aggregatum]|uniref:uncharacterized protein n=1 Tax=Polychytrium aggregatum TaxID=110093 RepID=UPI0022FDD160|nr:uncharacterized protein BJ171DRAFT_567546 [Polychytrium aggregatum]KAI9205369.1 hypothetical protein BJ171DRAFT_567546 [Polychytrium aggregatum]
MSHRRRQGPKPPSFVDCISADDAEAALDRLLDCLYGQPRTGSATSPTATAGAAAALISADAEPHSEPHSEYNDPHTPSKILPPPPASSDAVFPDTFVTHVRKHPDPVAFCLSVARRLSPQIVAERSVPVIRKLVKGLAFTCNKLFNRQEREGERLHQQNEPVLEEPVGHALIKQQERLLEMLQDPHITPLLSILIESFRLPIDEPIHDRVLCDLFNRLCELQASPELTQLVMTYGLYGRFDIPELLSKFVEWMDMHSVQLVVGKNTDLQKSFADRLERQCTQHLETAEAALDSGRWPSPETLSSLKVLSKHGVKFLNKWRLPLPNFLSLSIGCRLQSMFWLINDCIFSQSCRLDFDPQGCESILELIEAIVMESDELCDSAATVDPSPNEPVSQQAQIRRSWKPLMQKAAVARFLQHTETQPTARFLASRFALGSFYDQTAVRLPTVPLKATRHSSNRPELSIYTNPAPIHFVDTPEQLGALLELLKGPADAEAPVDIVAVGIDCEWRPDILNISVDAGAAAIAPSILQLALERAAEGGQVCFIVDLLCLDNTALAELIRTVFDSVDYTKLGFDLRSDIGKLAAQYPAIPTQIRNLVDFSTVPLPSEAQIDALASSPIGNRQEPAHLESNKKRGRSKFLPSLGEATQVYLQRSIDKTHRISDWNRRPLRRAQLNYAAMDSLVLLDLFKVHKQILESQPPPAESKRRKRKPKAGTEHADPL